MNSNLFGHSQAWVNFSYFSFLGSVGLVSTGILFTPIDWWMRSYLIIGMVMLIQSSINVTKTLRDNHESERLINRLDDARTEKLIRDVHGEPLEMTGRTTQVHGQSNG
jgi:hypothetical protein